MDNSIKKELKILIVGALPPPTGGDSVWLKLFANYLISAKIALKIVNTSVIGRRFSVNGSGRNLFLELIRCLKIWGDLLFKILLFKPSVVHLNTNCSPLGLFRDFISIYIAFIFSIPLILHCHANVPFSLNKSRIGRLIFIKCLSYASRIFVLNDRSLRYVKVCAGASCFIIPNFVETHFVQENKQINEEIKTALFVGHIVESKGIFELLRLANAMTNMNFICAGSILIDLNKIVVPNNVTFTGDVSRIKLIDLYKSADVFIFPTYTEGFSMAILEAMAVGVPVITTKVGANYKMLNDQGDFFVKVKSVDDIILALNGLKNSEIRRAASLSNIRKVKLNFTNEIVVPEIIRHYKSLQTVSN